MITSLMWGVAFYATVCNAQVGGHRIAVLNDLGEPIPYVRMYDGDNVGYSDINGVIRIASGGADKVSLHALGYKDTALFKSELYDMTELHLNSEKERLRSVNVGASPIDISELIEEVIENSWRVYKEHYSIPLQVEMSSVVTIDDRTYSARVDSGVLRYFSNRDWFPLISVGADKQYYAWDESPGELVGVVRFGVNRYLEEHFPLNPISPPLVDLSRDQIDILSINDGIEEVRIVSDTVLGDCYEVYLRFDIEAKLLLSMEKRLVTVRESAPVYGRDTLIYLSPFSLYTSFSFEINSKGYFLKKANIEKEERVRNLISEETIDSGANLKIDILGIYNTDSWRNMRSAKDVYFFPKSLRITNWIEGLERSQN